LKKLEGKLPPPPPPPGQDDPQLVDCLPLGVRLAMILAQEKALLNRGSEELAEADLPPSTWGILTEWDRSRGKLNKALKAARRKAGVPADRPHAVRVRELPLVADVRALMDKWERTAEVSGSLPTPGDREQGEGQEVPDQKGSEFVG
jgi:hypothetical protein